MKAGPIGPGKDNAMRFGAHIPHPPLHHSRFVVGRDMRGRWVVRDREGSVNGPFSDRAAAVHFALEESDRVPGAVCCAPDDAIISPDPFGDRAAKSS